MKKTFFTQTITTFFLLALSPMAFAKPQTADPRAEAQTLYEDAMRLMGAKDYASACPKLDEVVRLYPEGLGAWIELGRCEEARGRLARAYSVYRAAEAGASNAGQTDRNRRAGELARALEPRLSHWTIEVPAATRNLPGLIVRVDGARFELADWNKPIPVDGGKHVIVAEATGKQAWTKEIEIARERDSVTVRVDMLQEQDTSPANAVVSSPGNSEAASQASGVSPLRAAGFVGGGLGAAALLGGAIAGGIAMARHNDAVDGGHCLADGRCDQVGGALEADSRSAGIASTVLLIAGSVFVAGGVTMVVMSYGKTENAVRVGVTPSGFVVGGSF